MKKILKNSIYAVCIILYLIILSFAYTRMNIERLSEDIKVFSGMFLALGLLSLERAYKRDDGKIAILGIELLVISFYSLSIMHMVALLKCEFIPYVLISSVIVGIYYILKVIVLYTKERKKDLKNLSDISEIVKKDEPVKKEAKKTKERKEELKIKLKEKEEKEKNTKKETKKKKTTTSKKNTSDNKPKRKNPKTKNITKSEIEKNTESKNKKSSKQKQSESKKKEITTTKKKTTKKEEVNKND